MNNPSYNEEALLKEGKVGSNFIGIRIIYLLVIQIYDVYLIDFYPQAIKHLKILIIFSGCLGHGDMNVGFVIVKKFHAHYKFISARPVVTSVNICMLEYLFSVTKKKLV